MKTVNKILYFFILIVLLPSSSCRKNDYNLFHKIEPIDFLSASKYEKLVIEIQYVSGYEPLQYTLDELKKFLEKHLNKPEGISYTLKSIASPSKSFYSKYDLEKIENKNREHYTKGNTLTVYVFLADGEYAGNSGNSKVLGIMYDHTSVCIFKKTIQDYSGGTFQPSESILETTVAEHEFGHLMGLVNNGTPQQSLHEDGPNGHHCTNQNCLMYYLVETSDVISILLGGQIPELDSQCINDLVANGGK